jgi:hypothetical protein
MAVRNQHVRRSSRYVHKTIDGVLYAFSGDTFVGISRVRYMAEKAVKGEFTLDGIITEELAEADN